MTANRRRTSGADGKKTISPSLLFLGLCLCILALRATYTESPTADTAVAMDNPADAIYSLTLSGLLIFAPLAWLIWQMAGGRLRYRFTGIEIGLVVFFVASIISGVGASNKRLAITQTAILLGPILSAVLLVQVLDSLAKVRLLLVVVCASAVVSAYQCAEQFFVSNEMTIEQYEKAPETLLEPLGIAPGSFQQFLFEHRIYSRGVRGFFTTSNSAGSFALMASLAAMALLLDQIRTDKTRGTRSRDQLLRAGAAAVVLAGLLLTRSKGGILGFAFGLALLLVLLRGGRWLGVHRKFVRRVLLPAGLVVVGSAVWLVIAYGSEHGRLPGGNSMLVRWQYWAATAEMIRDHALTGVGAGNFAQVYTRYKPAAAPEAVVDPHNLPLSLLAQFGPLGLVGFLLMVGGAIRQTIRMRTEQALSPADNAASPARRLPVLALVAICATLLVVRPMMIPLPAGSHSFADIYPIIVLYVAPTAAFLIGFLMLAGSGPRRDTSEASSSRLFTIALGSAVAGVLVHNLIDFAIFEPGVWTTFWFLLAGLVAAKGHEHPPAIDRAVSAKGTLGFSVAVVVLLGAYGYVVWNPLYQVATRMHAARQAAMAGQFNQAHRLLEAAARADALNPDPLGLDGQVFVQQYALTPTNQPALLQEAARRFEQAIKTNPAGYKSYERLASVRADLGQYDDAIQAYTGAIDRYPGLGRLWLERAQVNEQLGHRIAALADYRRAVEIEDAFRRQFRQMYPQRKPVSRIGDANYQLAQERIAALSQQTARAPNAQET